MSDLDLFTPTTAPNPAATPKKCRRHTWEPVPDFAWTPTMPNELFCPRCGAAKNPDAARRGKNNRARGNRTSRDLAKFLPGGRNVEALKVPWDVEAPGVRIQVKRLSERPSHNAMIDLLMAIDRPADLLRAVYYVRPRQALQSGITLLPLREWVDEHGWGFPLDARLLNGAIALIEMPLPTFRDTHIGRAA